MYSIKSDHSHTVYYKVSETSAASVSPKCPVNLCEMKLFRDIAYLRPTLRPTFIILTVYYPTLPNTNVCANSSVRAYGLKYLSSKLH